MSFVLDLTRGTARVRQVVFNRGQPRPTVSIGRAAAWSIEAEDLEDVHAFVSFDGAALMVRSAEEHNPAWLDGRAVPCAWTPVGRAGILALGNARIAVTAKEDHVRPGYDDDEPTGQIELRPQPPSHLRTTTDATGITAIKTMPEPPRDEGNAVTGDEPTGEMTGARAPGRGLLPRPRVPPRAPVPPRDVPDFDESTQLRPAPAPPARQSQQPQQAPPVAYASHPAPPRADLDDEERTNALDLQAMQAAQVAQRAPAPAARPARPNIAIAADETDEATRMLALEKQPARPTATVPLAAGHPLASAYASTVPAPTPAAGQRAASYPSAQVFHAGSPAPMPAAALQAPPPRATEPPPSESTQLRPLQAPSMNRAPRVVDPFAKTGGDLGAIAPPPPQPPPPQFSQPALPVPFPSNPAAAIGSVPQMPGVADMTGPHAVLRAGPPPAPDQVHSTGTGATTTKKKSSSLALGVSIGMLIASGYYCFTVFTQGRVGTGPSARTNTPVGPAAVVDAGAALPVIAAAVSDGGAFSVAQNRSVLPAPMFPHKGAVDAGTESDTLDGGLATMQRAAVDAVAEGDLGRAILFYDQLAAQQPDVRAYAAAARILRAQVAADAGSGPGRRF